MMMVKEEESSYITEARKVKNFKTLCLDDRILKAVAKVRWPKPTLVQAVVIPHVLEGKDVIAKSKTGSGKTGAFVLSALQVLLKQVDPIPGTVCVLVPTKTLAAQTTKVLQSLMKWIANLSVVNVSSGSTEVVKTQLLRDPHIIVGTPMAVLAIAPSTTLLGNLALLILDEADLQLSYGYDDDLTNLRQYFPPVLQTILVSATLSAEVKSLSVHLNNPITLDLSKASQGEASLEQYVVICKTEDKFLLLYTLLKLNLIRGKNIIFVSDTNRCYRVKLFLEKFSISCCVLNYELPSNCVIHAIDQFNRGVYDILVATDDNQSQDVNVSRGIDFECVDNILNFDFPTTPQMYVHRIGRTARGFNAGTALTFVTSQNSSKLKVLEDHLNKTSEAECTLKSYNFNISSIEGFRYRCLDAYRSVTKFAIEEARRKEIKQEMMNSEKLKTFFADNPKDLEVLRHDKVAKPREVKEHLSTVPEYLIPQMLKGKIEQGKKKKQKRRKGFEINKVKRGNYKGKGTKRKADPLKTFKSKKQVMG